MMTFTTRYISQYLGRPASDIMSDHHFKNWEFERSIETDLYTIIVDYISKDNGMSIIANVKDITDTIFIYYKDSIYFHNEISDVSKTSNREQIVKDHGPPSRSGDRTSDPVFGDTAAWDRFDKGDHHIHFEYDVNDGSVSRITLMTPGAAP